MGDRRGKGVVHIESEDNGFHTTHESDSDFVSKATTPESGSDCVSEAPSSSKEKIEGERDSVTSLDDHRHRREELRRMDCGRQRRSTGNTSSRGATSALHGNLQVSLGSAVQIREGAEREVQHTEVEAMVFGAIVRREVRAQMCVKVRRERPTACVGESAGRRGIGEVTWTRTGVGEPAGWSDVGDLASTGVGEPAGRREVGDLASIGVGFADTAVEANCAASTGLGGSEAMPSPVATVPAGSNPRPSGTRSYS